MPEAAFAAAPHRRAAWPWAIPAAGSWFFALCSIAAIAMVLIMPADGSVPHIFGAWVDGTLFTGMGLTYPGVAGLVLAIAEATAVLAGLVLTLSPAPVARRAGLIVVIAWNALWLANAIYFVCVAGRPVWLPLTIAFAAFFACTAAWAARRW
jgi:hypothetical protein